MAQQSKVPAALAEDQVPEPSPRRFGTLLWLPWACIWYMDIYAGGKNTHTKLTYIISYMK